MIEVDETELTAFFSVLPEVQSQDEAEFFAALLFTKVVDGIRIEFSASAHFEDVRFDLRREGVELQLLNYVLKDVESLVIESDRGGRAWLHARSRHKQEMWLAVEPSITLNLTGCRYIAQQGDTRDRASPRR